MQYLLLSTQEPGIRPDHPAVSPQIKTSPALPSVALHALGVETKTPYAVDLNPPTPLSPSSFPAHLKRTLTFGRPSTPQFVHSRTPAPRPLASFTSTAIREW
jgi:hypothetical protein